MTIDQSLVLKEAQSIAATAHTDGIEVGAGKLESKPAFVRGLVTTAGTGTGTCSIVASGSNDDSTYVKIATGAAKVGTTFVKGDIIKVPIPPNEYKYLRGEVVITGTIAGTIFMDVELG